MNDFRGLIVWQKAIDLFEDLVKDIETFPKTEGVEIPLNDDKSRGNS